MTSTNEPQILVTVTIEGHPYSVLRDLQTAKASAKRKVRIELNLRRPGSIISEPHWLPEIVYGDTSPAFEHLGMLSRQGYLQPDVETRIAHLIEEFGYVTR